MLGPGLSLGLLPCFCSSVYLLINNCCNNSPAICPSVLWHPQPQSKAQQGKPKEKQNWAIMRAQKKSVLKRPPLPSHSPSVTSPTSSSLQSSAGGNSGEPTLPREDLGRAKPVSPAAGEKGSLQWGEFGTRTARVACRFEWEMSQRAFEHLVPSWWCCLGRVRWYILGAGFEIKEHCLLPLCSFCFVLASSPFMKSSGTLSQH